MIDTKAIAAQVGGESILFAQRADKLIAKNLIDEAMKLCEAGVRSFPFYPEGHYTLGRCYELSQRYDEAKTEYERTLFYAPEHIQALRALARIYFRNNLSGPGYALLLKAALVNPLDPGLISELKANNIQPFILGESDEVTIEAGEQAQATEQTAEEQFEQVVQEDTAQTETEETATEEEPSEEIFEEQIPAQEEPVIEIADELAQDIPSAEASVAADEDTEKIIIDPEAAGEENIPPDSGEIKSVEPDILSGMIETEDSEVPVIPDETGDIEEQLFMEEEPEGPPQLESAVEKDELPVHPPDLSQYDNVKDDFSTLMEDIFRPVDDEEESDEEWSEEMKEEEEETAPEEEHEQLVEEKPILDTSVIFLEEKQADMREKQESSPEDIPPVETGAEQPAQPLAEESVPKEEPVISEETAAEEIPPVEEPPASEPVVEDDLSKVIERIEHVEEQGPAKEEKSEPAKEEPAAPEPVASPAILDEEAVNIEDIMSNPSLLTPTFGEILIAQKKFEDARRVFLELAKRDPENPRFKKKIEFLDKLVAINKN